MPNYWLMKSEPDVFSIEDLKNAKDQTEPWDGIRNYQARNYLRDDMKKGDRVLFYHSRCEKPAVVGLARIASRQAVPDPLQFDPNSKYFDPKSDPENPRWLMVYLSFEAVFSQPVTLGAMKQDPKLEGMLVIRRGMRLSIQPVSGEHFRRVTSLGKPIKD